MLVYRRKNFPVRYHPFQLFLVILLVFFTSCSIETPTQQVPAVSTVIKQVSSQYPKAEITFQAQLIPELPEGQNLYVEFLDEVTGLAMNAVQIMMEKQDANNYTLKMPIVVGSVIKYRYVRDNDLFKIEYTKQGQQIRYRMYYVDGPGIVRDTIAAWKSSPLVGSTGRIQGQVSVKGNNSPVVNALVTAGGMQTVSASDGSFLLEGLPPGIHNVVVYDMNGGFQTFQQGAVVAPDSTTPAMIQVILKETVDITFLVTPPKDNLEGIPIRMVGNILSLGNTFSDLPGGMSIIPTQAPLLAVLPDGRYSITMKLPIGLDLRYKYTLGDGFWNAERSFTGEVRLRQLIVPDHDTTVEDFIDSWKISPLDPVTFNLSVPENTPVRDTVSIQFNPFSWTTPIPMWPAGNNRWFYILYNPINVLSGASYRFCRNDLCGIADAVETRGSSAPGILIDSPEDEPRYENVINAWAWLEKKSDPVVVPAVEINRRDGNFVTGVEFLPQYHPSWQPRLISALENVRDIGANTLIITPTWHVTHQNPPVFEIIPGQDALWSDLSQLIIQAQQKGLGVDIHPILVYPGNPSEWWQNSIRDDGWWQSWFDRYRTFILHHADLAAQTGAKTLIIGDEDLLSAFPNGQVKDGSSSGIPADEVDRWKKLFKDVRARYTGKLSWFVHYNGQTVQIPEFVSELDGIFVQVSPPITTSDTDNQADIEAAFSTIVDSNIYAIVEKYGLPVVVGLKLPSLKGVLDGCVESNGSCLPMRSFDTPAGEYPDTVLDIKLQADSYTSLLTVINQRPWIAGFYSIGYFPPANLVDSSNSIHGKPASDVLWYWYHRFLGVASP